MAAHGTERDMDKRVTYLRSEQMAQGERLLEVERQLKDVLARLDMVEQLMGGGATLGGDLDS